MAKESRPKIRIEWSSADRVLEGLALGLLLLQILFPAVYYGDLPEKVPQHFNFQGEVDAYGPPSFVWFLPLIGVGIYLLMTFINRSPHIFNYPVTITAENAEQQYLAATKLIRIMKTGIMALFAFLVWDIVKGALDGKSALGAWPVFIIFGGTAVMMVWYFRTAYQKK